MQPPGFLQKQSLPGADRRRALQNVSERGNICAFRMASLNRLLELLRIAKQDERFTGL
jgi:hypothetical protein